MKPHALPGVAGETALPAPRLTSAVPPQNMAEALAAWQLSLQVEDKAERWVKQGVAAVRSAALLYGWSHPRDITMKDLVAHLARMRNKGRDAKTRNNFVDFLRAFCACCKGQGIIAENPIGEDAPRARVTKKDVRLVPTQEQVRRLIREARKDHRKKDRWLVYLTAATANLRWRTLKLLEWSHVFEDEPIPYLKMPANILKGRDPRIVFLTRELADALRDHRKKSHGRGVYQRKLEGRSFEGAWVFESVPKWDSFVADCRAAELDRGEKGGPTLSFHSLRHFASNMGRLRGMSDEERSFQNTHASTRMTAEVYTNSSWLELGRKVLETPGLLSQREGGARPRVKKSEEKELTQGGDLSEHHADADEIEHAQLAPSDAAGLTGARRRHLRSRGAGRDEGCNSRGGRGAHQIRDASDRVTGSNPVTLIQAPAGLSDLAGQLLKLATDLISTAARLHEEARHGSGCVEPDPHPHPHPDNPEPDEDD